MIGVFCAFIALFVVLWQRPRDWREVSAALTALGLRVHPEGPPLDPSGAPYLLVLTPLGCRYMRSYRRALAYKLSIIPLFPSV